MKLNGMQVDDLEISEFSAVEPSRIRLTRKNYDYSSPKSLEKTTGVWNGNDSTSSLSPAEIPAAAGRLKIICFLLLTLVVVLLTTSSILITILVNRVQATERRIGAVETYLHTQTADGEDSNNYNGSGEKTSSDAKLEDLKLEITANQELMNNYDARLALLEAYATVLNTTFLEYKLGNLETSNNDLKADITNLNDSLLKRNSEIIDINAYIQDHNNRLKQLEIHHEFLNASFQHYGDRLMKMEEYISTVNNSFEENIIRITELDAYITTNNDSLQQCSTEIANINAYIRNINDSIENYINATVQDLSIRTLQLERQNIDVNATLQDLGNRTLQLERQTTSINGQVQDLSTTMNMQLQSQTAEINVTVQELRTRTLQLEWQTTYINATIRDLSAQTMQNEINIADIETTAQDLNTNMERLENTMNERNATVQEHHSRITQLEFQIADINVTAESCNTRLAQIETDTTSYDAYLQEFSSRVSNLEFSSNEINKTLEDCGLRLGQIETNRLNDSLAIQDFDARLKEIENRTDILEQHLWNRSSLSGGLDNLDDAVQYSNLTSGLQKGFTVTQPVLKTDPLMFQTALYNPSGGYNMTTGKFVCTYPGIHVFIATIFVDSVTDSMVSCYIYHNEQPKTLVSSSVQNSADTHIVSGTNAFVTFLEIGDEVYLSSCKRDAWRGGGDMTSLTTFSGFFIP